MGPQNLARSCRACTGSNGVLAVRRLPISLNPIFFQGTTHDEFQVPPGGRFVIGDTTFIVVGATPAVLLADLPMPSTELTCSAEELRAIQVCRCRRAHRGAGRPARCDSLFAQRGRAGTPRWPAVLLRGIPRAEDAAVLRLHHPPGSRDTGRFEVRVVKNRQGLTDKFRPSRRLVLEAMERRRQSVMHIWQKGEASQEFTVQAGCNWAICTPLDSEDRGGSACHWTRCWVPLRSRDVLGLYLTGSLPTARADRVARDELLKSDLKFTELVADMFHSLRLQGDMQRRLGQFKTFLPRPVHRRCWPAWRARTWKIFSGPARPW